MLRLLTFLVPHRKLVAALVLANFALSGLLIVTPLVIKAIVDDVIGGQQMHLLLPYLGLLFGVTVLRSAAGYFYTYGQNETRPVANDRRAHLALSEAARPAL